MNSIFRQKIEERAAETLSVNPPAMTGWAVKTSDVFENELAKNPFFASINNISTEDGLRTLRLDSVKFGTSFVTKAPGVAKGEKTYINPKTHDMTSYGASWGKLSDTNVSGAEIAMGDMIFSGGHNQAPTVVGMMVRKQKGTDTLNHSEKEHSEAKPADLAPLQGPIGDINLDQELKKAGVTVPNFSGIMPHRIDPDTGAKKKGPDTTHKSISGGNLRTGTALIDNTSLRIATEAAKIINSIKF